MKGEECEQVELNYVPFARITEGENTALVFSPSG